MNYCAFTNDSLTTMYEVVRGALDADDTLKARGEEIRFRVCETAEWKQHAADLEMEMIKRGMIFEVITVIGPKVRQSFPYRMDEAASWCRHDAARSSLSTPRATIFRASSGNGRCSALASSQGARIHTSRSSSVVRITGIAFGWIGSTTAFGAAVDEMRSGDRLRLSATVALELGPEPAKGERRSVLIEREPHHVLLFGLRVRLRRIFRETIGRDQAAAFRFNHPRQSVMMCSGCW
jgi:hypothetical protein